MHNIVVQIMNVYGLKIVSVKTFNDAIAYLTSN